MQLFNEMCTYPIYGKVLNQDSTKPTKEEMITQLANECDMLQPKNTTFNKYVKNNPYMNGRGGREVTDIFRQGRKVQWSPLWKLQHLFSHTFQTFWLNSLKNPKIRTKIS